jgi:hypothetical protein
LPAALKHRQQIDRWFRRKTPEEEKREETELLTWTKEFAKLDSYSKIKKFDHIAYMLKKAPKQFFTEWFGRYKKGLKEKIKNLATEVETHAERIKFLEVIGAALGNRKMRDKKKYKELVVKIFEPEIKNLARNIEKDADKERYSRAIGAIPNIISKKKIASEFLNAVEIETSKRILVELTKAHGMWESLTREKRISLRTDLSHKSFTYAQYLIENAPKNFFKMKFKRHKREFYKLLDKMAFTIDSYRSNIMERLFDPYRNIESYLTDRRKTFADKISENFITTVINSLMNKRYIKDVGKCAKIIAEMYKIEFFAVAERIQLNHSNLKRFIDDQIQKHIAHIKNQKLSEKTKKVLYEHILKSIIRRIYYATSTKSIYLKETVRYILDKGEKSPALKGETGKMLKETILKLVRLKNISADTIDLARKRKVLSKKEAREAKEQLAKMPDLPIILPA